MGEFLLIILVLGIGLAIACIRIVPEQQMYIVETFGRYTKTLSPGLNFILVPVQRIAGVMDLRIQEVHSEVSVKTDDNVFVKLPVNLQLRVVPENASDAFYRLKDSHSQISNWVLNSIRSISSGMTLEDMYKDRDRIVTSVSEQLAAKLRSYGYGLETVLIDQPTVSESVQESFNNVMAAKREAEAAEQQGRAAKTRLVAVAEAEAEAQKKRAEGLAEARKILASGFALSVEEFRAKGVSAAEAMHMLIETNRIDALREASKHGNLIVMNLNGENANVTLPLPDVRSAKSEATET
ncbi:MAG: SPFH domain-containing protein [Pseudomonadota bacterium]